ncbi:MAG: hypothetical protein LBJ86_00245 [Spirochaetaceae bacterium]|jgi:hypothetical protein|nr:hypothetical protein [Spirochaetaceae bacterium]
MANKPDEFPIFTPLDKQTIENSIEKLNSYISGLNSKGEIPGLSIQGTTFYDILDRIEKRRVYFYIFYNGRDMGELNEGALLCFWILKLAPFTSSNSSFAFLNVRIALSIFFHTLFFVAGKNGKKVNSTRQIVENLFYAFCYRDLSKEAIMALAESLIY